MPQSEYAMKLQKFIMDTFFSDITFFGTTLFYAVVLLILAKVDFSAFIRALVIMVVVELVSAGIKFVYPKKRPVSEHHGNSLWKRWDANSFPSIHSARVAALTVILINLYPYDMVIVAVSTLITIAVGYSRVYLKKHDWNDVLGGFAIGALISIAGVTA
jgi:membrane-associated phospholipid phosphatase